MKDAQTYIREYANPQEHMPDIVRRAQKDAYDEGYAKAFEAAVKMATETDERVAKLTVEALTQ